MLPSRGSAPEVGEAHCSTICYIASCAEVDYNILLQKQSILRTKTIYAKIYNEIYKYIRYSQSNLKYT